MSTGYHLKIHIALSFRKRKRGLTDIYRQKARAAILAGSDEKSALPQSHKYYCNLSPSFRFQTTKKAEAEYLATICWGDSLEVTISDANKGAVNEDTVITVTITPNNGEWTLGVDKVVLTVKSNATLAFTAAWKAFEKELIDASLKADLVQLNGYYQYTPRIICTCEISECIPFAHIIRCVVEGNHIACILSNTQLAQAWGISVADVLSAAQQMKDLGYEIRNHATNPQIDEGNWLIPYAFPTLTPLSVQLWKKLI